MTLELLTAGGFEDTELAAELHPVVGKLNVPLEIRFPLRLSNSTVGLGNLTSMSRFESANYNSQRRLDPDQNESGSLAVLNSVGDPDPHVFGPPGSGSFSFLIKVLSGLK